tara:strand:- start:4069 stop:4968 length:900 start_codon:yes stop_codon:yes gene_type:complete
MTAANVPILRSTAAAYAFLISHWQRALLAAAPYTLAYLAQLVLLGSVDAATASPALAMLSFMLSLATVVASLALSASCLRMAVLGDYSGRFGLKAGQDEWRIFLVGLLVSLLTMIVFVLIFMFWATVANSVAGAALQSSGVAPEEAGLELADAMAYMSNAGWVIVVVTGLMGAGMMTWLSARLVMAFPATIADHKIRVLSVWPLSDGNATRIAVALILTSLPLFVLEVGAYELLCAILGSRPLYAPFTVGPDATNIEAFASLQEYMRWNGLMAFLNVPVFSGLYAYIYRNRIAARDGRG